MVGVGLIGAFVVVGLVMSSPRWLAPGAGDKTLTPPDDQAGQSAQAPSEAEKSRIEVWIQAEGLNSYGDPADTLYAGGTPLFDETTGQYIDRYDYILGNHPDRPWNE
jgi:hypothetical protein